MQLRCAVLDDFQHVATTVADWSPVRDHVEVTSFTEHFTTTDELVAAFAEWSRRPQLDLKCALG